MNDILTRLPPTATITGFVGYGGAYNQFSVRAETARADIAVVCAAHAKEYARGTAATTPASYWFYEDIFVECEAYPGLRIYIDVEHTPGKQPDIRVDPWVITRIEFYPEVDISRGPPAAVAALFRQIGEFLTHLTAEAQ